MVISIRELPIYGALSPTLATADLCAVAYNCTVNTVRLGHWPGWRVLGVRRQALSWHLGCFLLRLWSFNGDDGMAVSRMSRVKGGIIDQGPDVPGQAPNTCVFNGMLTFSWAA